MERVGFLTRISDGKEFSLGFGSMRVGRERRADLVIADKTVSRHHADIIYESGRYVLYDHSTNGTWVNGNLVAVAQPLRERDKVKFGKIEFVFSTKSVPKSQAAGLRQVTEPERVSGSSTAIMRGGRGKGRTVRRIKRAGIVLLVLVIAAVVVYFALPEVANSVISRLPQPLQDLLSR
ncbi:MAG: FHA domain-containing protein [Gemmatimonadetes bacterium]|nr:FHA domain-containing protein [Gemmatimonadota bacterium]NIV22338.1 FHA domain-containing protein [Gemmatimonadota bacterium]